MCGWVCAGRGRMLGGDVGWDARLGRCGGGRELMLGPRRGGRGIRGGRIMRRLRMVGRVYRGTFECRGLLGGVLVVSLSLLVSL